jgi:CAI-1 autoinducer synthase
VFCAPATAKNRSLIRMTVNADLSDADLERILQVCAEIRDEVGMSNWPVNRRNVIRSARAE